MELGCAEFAVPGGSLEEKLKVLESHGMWLELVNDGERTVEDIQEVTSGFKVGIKSIQAYLQHEVSLLSPDDRERGAAISHVKESIGIGSELGAENVVVVITYGKPGVGDPFDESVRIFGELGRFGRELGITVSLEPLGSSKTSFLPTAGEVLDLVREVNSENVKLMIDTMHAGSGDLRVERAIEELAHELSEIQLRDTDSRPPGGGTLEFGSILRTVREEFNGLLCLEYHPGSDPEGDFMRARETVSDVIPEV